MESITDLAGDLGITTRTLRYYEQLGLLRPVPRTGRSPRRYDADARARAERIRRMQAAGLSLDAIRIVLDLREEVARLDGDEGQDRAGEAQQEARPARERLLLIIDALRAHHAGAQGRAERLTQDLAEARHLTDTLARDLAICEQRLALREQTPAAVAGAGHSASGVTPAGEQIVPTDAGREAR